MNAYRDDLAPQDAAFTPKMYRMFCGCLARVPADVASTAFHCRASPRGRTLYADWAGCQQFSAAAGGGASPGRVCH
jgi:hypothetical protein